MSGHDAVTGYEAQMREYGFHAVAESHKQFDASGTVHRPMVGRVALGAMRTGLRVVNNVPLLTRRMIDAENDFRGVEGTQPWPTGLTSQLRPHHDFTLIDETSDPNAPF